MRISGLLPLPLLALAMILPPASPALANILIQINKSAQEMTVMVDGVPKYDWPVSTGRSGYSTPSGSYTPFRMEAEHYSKEWDDAPMPHSIFFTKQGHAIHGSLETKRLGSPVSHGCVRLSPQNAAILYALVEDEGMANTKVVITGGGGDQPRIAQQRKQRYPNWSNGYDNGGYYGRPPRWAWGGWGYAPPPPPPPRWYGRGW